VGQTIQISNNLLAPNGTIIINGNGPGNATVAFSVTGDVITAQSVAHYGNYSTHLYGSVSHAPHAHRGLVRLQSNNFSASSPLSVFANGVVYFDAFSNSSVSGINLNVFNSLQENGTPRILGPSANINLNGDVTYNFSGLSVTGSTIEPNLNLGTSTRTFAINAGSNSSSLVLASNVTSATAGVGILKTGEGSLIGSGSWTFSGNTTIQEGGIICGAANALSPNSTIVLNGGNLRLNSNLLSITGYFDQRIGGLSSTLATSYAYLGDANLTLGANNSSNSYAGQFSGTGKFIKVGTGTQTLTGSSTQFSGEIEIQRGVLAITENNSLGAATVPVKATAGGTLRFNESFATSRSFDLTGGGALDVTATKQTTYSGATILGGFIRGAGTHVFGSQTYVAGSTIQSGTITSVTGPTTFANVTSAGSTTVTGTIFLWDGGQLSAAGQLTVNSATSIDTRAFESIGMLTLLGSGQMSHTVGSLVLGGGSVTILGQYNPATGIVSPGGALILRNGDDLVVRGGFLRNNGVITTSGNLVIDYGGLAKGAGDYDVGGTQLINGGQFLAGNSPGLVRNSNLTVIGPSLTGGDLNNASGTVGGFASSANGNTTNSGWSAIEYGNSANTTSGLTLQRGAGGKAQWQFRTTLNDGIGNTPGAPANFDPTQSYSWEIFRPRTNASASIQEPTAQLNTVATITLLDPSGTVLANTDANLNATLEFNRTLFLDPNTGLPISPAVGNFTFAFGLDLEGRPGTTISLLYQPVPEPGTILAFAAISAGLWRFRGRLMPTRN
jgi:autotransporter-associated beta strand protein